MAITRENLRPDFLYQRVLGHMYCRAWSIFTRGPGPPPGKLQVVIYFQAETGTNFPREATPPPVGVVWIRTRMSDGGILFFIFFLHVTGLAITLSSADALADLRLCCLHATKSSFSQQGTYGIG